MEIAVEGVGFSYGHRDVLQSLSCHLQSGKLTAILGVNGAGKSTLLKIIARLQAPNAGSVMLDGESLSGLSPRTLAQQMGYVSQSYVVPRLTVFEYLLIGRIPYRRQRYVTEDEAIVTEVLDHMELSDFANRWLTELSGGELQQIVIARALVQQPKVLLLDEPTNNLDLKNQVTVMKTIKERAARDGLTVVFSIHDINLAARFADRFLLLNEGQVLAAGGKEILEADSLSQVYNVPLTVYKVEEQLLIAPV